MVSLVNILPVIGALLPGILAILQTSWQKQLSFGRLSICGGKKSLSREGDCMVSIPQACRGNGLKVNLLLVRLALGYLPACMSPLLSLTACLSTAAVFNFSLGNFFTVLFLT